MRRYLRVFFEHFAQFVEPVGLACGRHAFRGGEAQVRAILRKRGVAVWNEPWELRGNVGEEPRLVGLEDFSEGGESKFGYELKQMRK